MRNAFGTYRIRLEVEGPVFIGSGQKITKKEYISLRDEAWIPDFQKLYMGIRQFGLAEEFERFMADPKQKDLKRWLEDHKIASKTYQEWIVYRVDSRDVNFRNNYNREILTFLRDAYGRPYVPGSSVKGMLRTLLLMEEICSDPQRWDEVRQQIRRQNRSESRGNNKSHLRTESGRMETEGLHLLKREKDRPGNAVNDVLAAFIVSDSEPLSNEDLVLAQKCDLKPDSENKKDPTPLPLVRECLRPGTIIECTLTVDEELLRRAGAEDFSIEKVRKAVKVFSTNYEEWFRSRFYNGLYDDLSENSVFLGGGAGFVSKTEVYPLFEEQASPVINDIFRKTMSSKIFRDHRHDVRGRNEVEPHVCKVTYYNGEIYEMGRCKLTLEEM